MGLCLLKGTTSSGSVAAHFELGKCFYGGYGTPRDEAEAVHHFKMGAEAGHVDALP